MKRSYKFPKMPKISNKVMQLALLFITIMIVGAIFMSQSNFYERFTNPPDATLEYYFMKKCPHCVEFNSVWNELSAKIKEENMNIALKKYDLQEKSNKEKIIKNNVTGAPTIIIDVKGKTTEFTGPRNVDDIVDFIKQNL